MRACKALGLPPAERRKPQGAAKSRDYAGFPEGMRSAGARRAGGSFDSPGISRGTRIVAIENCSLRFPTLRLTMPPTGRVRLRCRKRPGLRPWTHGLYTRLLIQLRVQGREALVILRGYGIPKGCRGEIEIPPHPFGPSGARIPAPQAKSFISDKHFPPQTDE